MKSFLKKAAAVCLSATLFLSGNPLILMYAEASETSIAKNLSGYWSFDEATGTTIADLSGNGHNAAMVGNTDAIHRNNGKFSNCLSFDGKTNSYIEIPDSNSLQLSGKTVSFWLKVDEKKTYNMIYGYDDAFDSYTGFYEDGNMKLYWTDETGKSVGTVAYTAPFESDWTFYAVVYDANEKAIRVYKNGEAVRIQNPNSVNSNFFPCNDGISSEPIKYIGARNTYGANLLSGSLDDFRIYDGPLNPNEISQLYRHNPEPLSTPMNLSATASDRQVELAWEPSTGNTGVAGYEIYRNGVLIGSSTAARYTDTGLSPETQYFYTVKAYDTFGRKSAFSNEAYVDTVPETTSSALLYMPFDEGLCDNTGNSPDGIWSNNTGSFTDGYQGKAVNVTSTTIRAPHNPIYDNLDKLTLNVWAKNNEVFSNPSSNYLIRKEGAFSLRGGLSGINGFIKFTINIGGIGYEVSNWSVLKAGQLSEWHLYSASYDGEYIRIFMDGKLAGEQQLSGRIDSKVSEILIGEFDGMVDNVYISNDTKDTDKPVFYSFSPQPGQTWVDENSKLTVGVRDSGKGVDIASIVMTVNGSKVNPQISGNHSDYHLTWNPPSPLTNGGKVSVSLNAADKEGNLSQTAYEFTVKDENDTIAPVATIYVDRTSPSTVIVYSNLSDKESGTDQNAKMSFSTDGINWSDDEIYTGIKELTVDGSVSSVYARFSDNDGNWTKPLRFIIDGANDQVAALKVNSGVQLFWKKQPGAVQYKVLRSRKLGWKGIMNLARDMKAGETIIPVDNTAGLRVGDQVHFGITADDYYVKNIIDSKSFEIDHALLRDATIAYSPLISGGWVYDYSHYTELASVSGNGFTDTTAETGTDYFYVIACTDGVNITGYLHPVNVKLTDNEILYDAALASNGGYAWKAGQNYSDTPELIDGDNTTFHNPMQYEDPTLRSRLNLGLHRFNFNQTVSLRMLELSQSNSAGNVQAGKIRVGFDDNSFITVNLESDPTVLCSTTGACNVYSIPLEKESKYAEILLSSPGTQNGRTSWNKVSFYSDEFCREPVTSATQVDKVSIEMDFSKQDGVLPTIFGTDEIFDNTEGLEPGWMVNGWQKSKDIFNLYRIQTGDFWPRGYGLDRVEIGRLAQDTSPSDVTLALTSVNPEVSLYLFNRSKIRIGNELMQAASTVRNNAISVTRGFEYTTPAGYPAGTPVYTYKNAGQIMRLQEAIPEFKMVKYENAYVSGITPISSEHVSTKPGFVDINDPIRTAELDIVVRKGEYRDGDVIKIGRECFLILSTDSTDPAKIKLHVRRGYDGTNDRYIQHNSAVLDVYKLLDYEPYYEGFKNDPTIFENYNWSNLKVTLDKIIKDGGAIPWFISYSTWYATQHRGRIASFESINGGSNNVVVDEYNSTHDDADWWYQINTDNNENDDAKIKGNMYQYYHEYLKILTGDAAGKVFYVRSHTGDRLRVVRTWNDSSYETESPEYIDLSAEGVEPGDAYMVVSAANHYANVAPKFWQYNADVFYNIAKYTRENYSDILSGKPIYFEYYLEPNLGSYGTWTKDSYIDSYNVFADTLRTGGPHFDCGFTKDEVLVGAGAIAGGLNPRIPITGTKGDYDFALSLLERSPVIDFISHHRYYVGSRIQKRENSWEYYMLKTYAKSLGKDIMVVDSEDSVATAGGTGSEEARHWAKFGVPYWLSNFVNSYYGDYGESGRLDFIIHFRNYCANEEGLGMFAPDRNGKLTADLVYWTIELFQSHTSRNNTSPDTLIKTNYISDQYGWVQGMGTIHGQTGKKKIHLVNKKDTPIIVNLNLLGVDNINSANMDSIIGGGQNQSIRDGYHPIDLTGAVITTKISDLHTIVLEPCSMNIISLETE